MALSPTRLDYRLRLSHVDRALELEESVLVSRHPSETQAHAVSRLLAWCLLRQEGLEFGPGLSTPEAADLWARGPTGDLTVWVECGAATADRMRKVLQHNHRVEAHVVLDNAARAEELAGELAALKLPRGAKPLTIWILDQSMLRALAERDERRQKWVVTIVGDHFYIDADGIAIDGAVERRLVEA